MLIIDSGFLRFIFLRLALTTYMFENIHENLSFGEQHEEAQIFIMSFETFTITYCHVLGGLTQTIHNNLKVNILTAWSNHTTS